MANVEVKVSLQERSYSVWVGEDLHLGECLSSMVQDRQIAIVSDDHVDSLYGSILLNQIQKHAASVIKITVKPGEQSKQWLNVEKITTALLEHRYDRKCLIIALGGGVVGDLAGFAAAIYQRGIEFIQMPTSLLAMVDSSVGGKTGINHLLGKNMIGAFHQPKMVLANVNWLQTLPTRELSAGLAEVIKHGAIADAQYFEDIRANMSQLLSFDSSALVQAVVRSCQIKAQVVSQDEREGGLRAILNFGHTFGHAIEAGLGYGEWLHGEAVGAGMVMASQLSHSLGLISSGDTQLVRDITAAAGLPIKGPAWDPSKYIALMAGDKKSEQGTPNFILLESIGKAIIRRAPEPHIIATLKTVNRV
jgi:shikimate kinase / 3-dehydroquinate synthase